ncbi:acetylxylan esterase [soil metagenome]
MKRSLYWLLPLVIGFISGAGTFMPAGRVMGQDERQATDASADEAEAAPSAVYPRGQQPKDGRLGPLTTLDDHFPFDPPESLPEWEDRAEQLRQRILIATGLWPMPQKTPLNPVIHGRVQREGFTVEKVYFESLPGHYVTGLLFRPEEVSGDVPAVLCPHGHGGRMEELSLQAVRNRIVDGQERFEESGRFPALARCAQLARMGCVAFIFDMLGYADSQQISYEVAHRFAEPRGNPVTDDGWLFYSTPAELRLQSIMGLQVWNGIRSLDFLEQLPGVDGSRIAVTGNSGGGTQTILLGAIDPRPIVTFPNGMVSTSMQGGCTCENCPLLRVGTGNVELTALFAPRPQAMTAVDDWTKDMMTDGYPQLQQVYRLYGKEDHVLCREFKHFPHNYNYVTRGMMYQWFNKHLGLGLPEPVVEEDYPLLTSEESAVWTEEHPKPEGGPAHEREVGHFFANDAHQQLESLREKDEPAYHSIVETAWKTIIGRSMPTPDAVQRENLLKQPVPGEGYILFKDILRLPSQNEEFPTVALYPDPNTAAATWRGETVIWIDAQGKSSLLDQQGKPVAEARNLVDQGYAVIAPDLFGQGEFLADGQTVEEQPIVENGRYYAGYTYGYNDTLFAKRVHDLLTLVAFTQSESASRPSQKVQLYGRRGAEPVAAAAALVAEDAIDGLTLASDDFRFASVASYRHPDFVPGSVKYGDLPALLSLLRVEFRTGDFNNPKE